MSRKKKLNIENNFELIQVEKKNIYSMKFVFFIFFIFLKRT